MRRRTAALELAAFAVVRDGEVAVTSRAFSQRALECLDDRRLELVRLRSFAEGQPVPRRRFRRGGPGGHAHRHPGGAARRGARAHRHRHGAYRRLLLSGAGKSRLRDQARRHGRHGTSTLDHERHLCRSPAVAAARRAVVDGSAVRCAAEAYVRMGVQPTYTCAPYLLAGKPKAGQQIGWAESNAVVFANAVLGARTMKYPDYLDICLALTGRAPKADCHLDAPRLATVRSTFRSKGRSTTPTMRRWAITSARSPRTRSRSSVALKARAPRTMT